MSLPRIVPNGYYVWEVQANCTSYDQLRPIQVKKHFCVFRPQNDGRQCEGKDIKFELCNVKVSNLQNVIVPQHYVIDHAKHSRRT